MPNICRSRATAQLIYDTVRNKIAQALVKGVLSEFPEAYTTSVTVTKSIAIAEAV